MLNRPSFDIIIMAKYCEKNVSIMMYMLTSVKDYPGYGLGKKTK